MFSMRTSVRVLVIAALAIALTPVAGAAKGSTRAEMGLTFDTCEGGGLEMPVVFQLPWHVLLKKDVEENLIKGLRDRCDQDLRLIFKVPKPLERLKRIGTLDLKYRAELLTMVPEKNHPRFWTSDESRDMR